MRLRATVLVVISALAALAAVAASGSAAVALRGSAAAAPRAQLTAFTCVRAVDPANRELSVRAVMRPLAGTVRMAMRFGLLEHPFGSAAEGVVRVGDLGAWIPPSDPTLGQQPGDVWQLSKPVFNLDLPGVYRLRVKFRWTGAHGHVIGTATRYSHACREPELRPDLLVRSIAVDPVPGNAAATVYVATIANRGATGAGPFEVLFVPGDGSAPTAHTIRFLGAHHARVLSFPGPACNASIPPTVTVDATNVVDDFNPANNELAAVCP